MTQLLAKLRGTPEQTSPCCESNGIITDTGDVVCADCGRHRGTLSPAAMIVFTTIIKHFGAPTEPVIIRDASVHFRNDHNETRNH
jgi:hypothetical protein